MINFKKVFLLIFHFSFFFIFSQSFEQGYYVNNDGIKVNGFINFNVTANSFDLKFKKDEKTDVVNIYSADILAFGVENSLKYIREEVLLETSSNILGNLSNDRAPKFEKKNVFLEVLVEGKYNLYRFRFNNKYLFFQKQMVMT